MKNFKKLEIWQFGFEIAIKTLTLTKSFSQTEKWDFSSQLNRAGFSIPSNIAEGNSRKSDKDKNRFMEISLGSCFELETQLLITKHLKIGDQILTEEILGLLDREEKMLISFSDTLLKTTTRT